MPVPDQGGTPAPGLRGVDNQLQVAFDETRAAPEAEADIEKRMRWDALVDHVPAGSEWLNGL